MPSVVYYILFTLEKRLFISFPKRYRTKRKKEENVLRKDRTS